MFSIQLLMFALLGGILPSIFWLAFWLREDKAHPEPKKLIVEAFMAGISCVLLVWPLQTFAKFLLSPTGETSLSIWIAWAAIEEVVKFGACYYIALRKKEDDEPIDAVIYMIVTALGFSALENALYILNPLLLSDFFGAYALGSSRFIGASLLHILSSSIVGIFLAFSFYKPGIHKKINIIMGLFFATLIHTLFNIAMIERSQGGLLDQPSNTSTLILFSLVWLGIMAIIVILEKVKALEINKSVIQ
jgi:protease PrsW